MDSNGTTIDLLNAKQDLDAKLIRMVGSPKVKLKEDSLRILRAIRFATTLDFKIDKDLKKYIKKYGHLLKKLSYYRKKEELDKIFSSPNVEYGINLIKELDLAKHLDLVNISSLIITTSPIGIWAQLVNNSNYKFTNNETDLINQIHELYNLNLLDEDVLYKYGLYLVSLVGEIKGIDRKLITIAYNELPIKCKNNIDINAMDICHILNKEPGPYLKRIFDVLEYKVLHKELSNNHEDISSYVEKTYKNKSF